MKNQKSQSGITLIALVVTIVVLLILAGVTIVYVLSDNSIFKAAQQAVDETDISVIFEYVGKIQSDIYVDTYLPDKEVSNIDTYVERYFPKTEWTVEEDGVTVSGDKLTAGTMTFTKLSSKKKYKVVIDDKGVAQRPVAATN